MRGFCEGERPDSNRRPPGPQPGALPTELRSPRGSNVAPWVSLAAVGTRTEEALGRRALNRAARQMLAAPGDALRPEELEGGSRSSVVPKGPSPQTSAGARPPQTKEVPNFERP